MNTAGFVFGKSLNYLERFADQLLVSMKIWAIIVKIISVETVFVFDEVFI
jgi:hypothetical protein